MKPTETPAIPEAPTDSPPTIPVDGTTARVDATQSAAEAPPVRKTAEERKSALSQMVANVSAQGYRVESQGDFQAVIIRGKRINHAVHIILSVLTAGLWLIVYGVVAATGGEKFEITQVDEWGTVSRQRLFP
jgi:hypothetical protein